MTLKEAIVGSRIGLRTLAKFASMSKSALSRLTNFGEYPSRRPECEVIDVIRTALAQYGINPADVEMPKSQIRRGFASKEPLRAAANITPLVPPAVGLEELHLMQLDRNVLSLFGLRTNPFLNDIEADEDVFSYKGHTTILDSIKDAIQERGFIAVCGPSGAGKTTIWDTIESEFGLRDDYVICKPALKHKEKLTPDHLVRALIYGLNGDDTRVRHDGEQRGRQLSRALIALRQGSVDRHAVLLIDDAHFCNMSVLRQLKTFYEEKIGRYRLLAIVLIGLPQLKEKLSLFPEIGNRIRLVEVPPVPVKEYLEFKLRRVGSSLDKIFDPQGLEAFLDRFRAPRRPPLGHPLIINATAIRAMCKLYENGGQAGERVSREIVDQLPGGTTRRVA